MFQGEAKTPHNVSLQYHTASADVTPASEDLNDDRVDVHAVCS